ncbi:phage tail assembly protein [Motilimonas sp. 1_MG-2023]|uniref:phage tail assembly protein n=1 Tax=Motilimonas sp. 1_MG-2023 TaxID=3062672 RepID=UPI0026E46163|nr:phage tail assembly protein [Motilimonas sp. 1_MG-2023]MDO6525430.1 phage tail assembly protein [Motilimonas sp. 1_MG-2023]
MTQTTPLINPIFTATITLDTPVIRKGGDVTTITLRKPKAGELRGLNLTDILQMDVNALGKLLPRISNPTLTEQEVQNLDPADLVQLGGEVAGFLVPKRMKDSQPNEASLPA